MNTLIADKTLVNEEDAVTWDSLGTFSAGITIATGQAFTVGTTTWTSSDEIDGTKIKDADYGDVDVSAGGAWTVSSVQNDSVALTTDTTGNYVATITDGLAIDGGDGGSEGATLTLAFDPTELLGNRTWGDGSTDTIVWTWNRATGTDPAMTFGNDFISLNGDLKILGDDLFMTTNTNRFVLMGDGTNYNPEAIDLGTDTDGNYVATIADDGIKCTVFLSLQTLALFKIAASTQAELSENGAGPLLLGDFLDTCAGDFFEVRGKKLGLIVSGGKP